MSNGTFALPAFSWYVMPAPSATRPLVEKEQVKSRLVLCPIKLLAPNSRDNSILSRLPPLLNCSPPFKSKLSDTNRWPLPRTPSDTEFSITFKLTEASSIFLKK
ncbi:MAG: hypothetical protein BWY84_00806 [Candidatus Aerophobetes bacterium ADurb.Bin490]|nr:MAG: hypothetical protein BWY84_00806 [Candidatus Aerophobetes bacterium ADurb.Bin490]